MHTRGKGQSVSDEAQHEDQVESDDDDHENHNFTKKQSTRERRSEDRASIRSDSSKKASSKRSSNAESNEISPVLSNNKPSRSSTRKKNFVSDILPEETPLAQRRSVGSEPRRKRLTLATPEEVPEEEEDKEEKDNSNKKEYVDNSHQEEVEDDDYVGDGSPKVSKNSDDEEEAEKGDNPDGVRRSQRTRKFIYQSYNDSWIFGERTAKGYPTIKEDVESQRNVRRSSRVRSRAAEQEEEDDEEHEDVEMGEDCRKETRRSTRSSVVSPKDGSKRSMRYIQNESSLDASDMYSRVKRGRVRSSGAYSGYESTVRNAKKASLKKSYRQAYENSSEDSDEESGSGEEDDFEEVTAKGKRKPSPVDQNGEEDVSNQEAPLSNRVKGKYCLRRIQPVERYQPLVTEFKPRSRNNSPPRSRTSRHSERLPCSPAMRSQRKRRQKAQNESTTSSSSSDEERFERRKNKSMSKARNRCLPMNFSPDDLTQGVVKDRMKVGSSLADVDPMKIDREVNFSHVGGLETYIRSLKEMILFPLLYPEIFQKFSIQPPRGVLFYGPPGTGKTLVARCLANECGQKDRRVAFFMRKGADCLSKWVGESERQLRLLFDQAFQMRPSIIFFDEIDGLAPVRSTRQDQIHSSIVSTLLALMDGLDARGEVIVIGATNRLDAIDPALRRPGRFDREFHFPLPSITARKEILDIHLKSWAPSPPSSLINYLSQKTVGYCGADLKALCAEAALLALRRRYPQVYQSKDKLMLDLSQINVERRDFDRAIQRLVPASQRSATGSGKPLTGTAVPLLENQLQSLITQTQALFPEGMTVLKQKGPLNGMKKQTSNQLFPRLLLSGGSCAHLASALLHHMERLPVHRLDLSTLHGLSARSPEEACVQLFHEARRNVPAIIYLPVVNRWWPIISETVKAAFLTQLGELDPELPILLLITEDSGSLGNCPEDLSSLFDENDGEVFEIREFNEDERRKFFRGVLLIKCIKPPLVRKARKENLEALPVAPPPPPRELNEKEKERLEKREEATLRELRIFLREILAKMARNKLFYVFTRPVDTNEVPDYLDIIKQPMDLETMMTKIDQHAYESARDFLADIELIVANALEYNPDRNPEDKQIRHRACTLRDTAYALIKAEMDTDFEEQCQEISKARKERKSKIATVVGAPLQPSDIIQTIAEPQENGALNKKDQRSVAQREKDGKYRKNPAKKRKMDSVDESVNVDDAVPVESVEMEVEQATDKAEEMKDEPEPAETTVMDDTQTSDAGDVDQQPDAEQDTASTTSKPKKTVTIDMQRLEELLETLVFITKGWNLEKMLRLYTKLAKLADRYSKLWDRTDLVKDIEEITKRITVSA